MKIVIATTEQERNDAFGVRIAVFVEEQGISRDDELDDLDATAIHCVAYDTDGTPVGAGRVCMDGALAKIGRMCVLASHRRHAVGGAVLETLERAAIEQGAHRFNLSAQLHAQRFYERNGYRAYGEVYDDVGILHIDMEKDV